MPIEMCSSPLNKNVVFQHKCSAAQDQLISDNIKKLLEQEVIQMSPFEAGQIISPIFLREKSDGSHRLILNLKNLNKDVVKHRFKMETFHSILNLVQKDCFMSSIDLKSAYYSVPIADDHSKFLKFTFKGVTYKFVVLPNGYTQGPRKFTKLCRVPIASLRTRGHIVAIYIDDIFITASTFELCLHSVFEVIKLFDDLGFYIHFDKSVLTPTTVLTVLGFVSNSVSMTVTLTDEKKSNTIAFCKTILRRELSTIRQVASLLGKLTSSFPAVQYGPLHYRHLEQDKYNALLQCKGNFDSKMKLSREAREDLKWWIHTLPNCSKRIDNGKITDTIYSDASNFAWGAVYKNQSTGGAWLPNELDFHINSKELLAGYFGLKALFKKTSSHVRMFCDNTTAVQCINKMGSCRSPSCDRIVKLIWEWARENNNFITAAYIPGVENVTADEESRSSHNEDLEWMLDTNLFLECITTLGYKVFKVIS